MANLNRIVLVGKIAGDVESRATVEGLAIAKFRLAVSRQAGLNSDAVLQSGTDLFDIIAWRKLAENCAKALKKGQLVLVEGRVQIRSFDDQTGQRHWVTEVVASDVRVLDQNVKIANETAPAFEETGVDEAETALANDLPF